MPHFVVDVNCNCIGGTTIFYFATILERSDSFQGRISSNQQIQIALDFPSIATGLQYDSVAQGIEGWARRQRADGTLNFLVELGPPATPHVEQINASCPTAGWRAWSRMGRGDLVRYRKRHRLSSHPCSQSVILHWASRRRHAATSHSAVCAQRGSSCCGSSSALPC